MIEYNILDKSKAINRYLSVVSDRLHERIFATENVYINGKFRTHSGIINKSTQFISDKSCGESTIILNYDGSINKFIVSITKEIVCNTNIVVNLNTNRLRAQVVVINNSSFVQSVKFNGINLVLSTVYIKSFDFLILDTVSISNCCTGTFEKQSDVLKKDIHYRFNHDIRPDTINKFELGSLKNVQNNQNISNSILISKNGNYVLSEINKSIILYSREADIQLHLNTFSNANIYIEKYIDTFNVQLLNKTKRGFISVINKTSMPINVIFSNNASIVVISSTKLTVGYSPYNNIISKFINSYTIENNITSKTVFEGIHEFHNYD
jgi:hypothetical protein